MNIDHLIISSLYDFSTDLVVQELERRNVKYVRLNREKLEEYRLTIDITCSSLEIKIGKENYRVTDELRSVYYRQPVFLRNTPGKALSINEHMDRDIVSLNDKLSAFLDLTLPQQRKETPHWWKKFKKHSPT